MPPRPLRKVVQFTGVVTATKFDGAFENITLTGVTTTQQFNTTIIETETLNITGISTLEIL